MNIFDIEQPSEIGNRLKKFLKEHIEPAEAEYEAHITSENRWSPWPKMEELKQKAKEQDLWNLYLTHSENGPGLTNLQYAPLAEMMGHIDWCSEVFNCSAPDTGNMEVLDRYGNDEQKSEWLQPLLDGEIRSAFAMTEPDVASSDATNISSTIVRDGDDYVINGKKWWITNAGDPRCKIIIFMGVSNPEANTYNRQSMILIPFDTPGITKVKPLQVFGYDDAPYGHYELHFENVRVPKENLLLGEGRGFEIAQGRLGPGRIHHCMRSIGAAEKGLAYIINRLFSRTAFGKPLIEQSLWTDRIAKLRCEIDMARMLTLKAAYLIDEKGVKAARKEISMIKLVGPDLACRCLDMAIQAHGAGGLCQNFPLAAMYANQRTLRLADGPDEVHARTITKLELKERKQ